MSSLSDRKIAWLLFAIAALLYTLTMCRTIYTGDDGDFELAMATLGVCHPTGYPLFTLLGRAFLLGLAPIIDEPAMRVNLMTALFGAAAVAMFFRFVAALIASRVVAISAALLLAFAPTLWQQSLSCEVYTLTALFLCTVLWLSVRLERGERVLAPLVLVYGLALTNNLTMSLFLPGFLLFAWRKVGFKKLFVYLPLFLLPLLLYAYVPLAAKLGNSPLKWGDPQTWPRFLQHVNGSQYRHLMFTEPLTTWHVRLWGYFYGALWKEFGGHFLLFALPGIAALWKKQRALLALTSWVFVGNIVYATNYAINDIYVYYIPSYLCVAAWMAVGLGEVGIWLSARKPALVRPLALLLLMTPLVQMTTHLSATDKSSNFLEADFAANILSSAPKDAVILTSNNIVFTLWYLKWVKHQRPDVAVLNADMLEGTLNNNTGWYFEHVQSQWPGLPSPFGFSREATSDGTYLQLLVNTALAEGRPVLLVSDDRLDSRRSQAKIPALYERLKPFTRVPWGIVQRLYEAGSAPDGTELLTQNAALWPQLKTRGIYAGWKDGDPLQLHILVRYFNAHKALAQLAEKQGQTELAREHYAGANLLFRDPEIEASIKRLSKASP
nr:DUF2723 domain-containing protein [Armatimonas sp.]